MATLQEQRQAAEDAALAIKVRQASIKAAQTIIDNVGTETAPRLAWARQVLSQPDLNLNQMLAYVIAKNSGATLAQIIGATDADVQTAVTGAVTALAG